MFAAWFWIRICLLSAVRFVGLRVAPQVNAAWQWWNALESKASSAKIPLRLNLDETSICVQPLCEKGTICISSRVARTIGHAVDKRLQRTRVTYLAVICDAPEIQINMPQFVLCNEATVKRRDADRLAAMMGPSVVLIRRKSAWLDAGVMVDILRWIARYLQPFMNSFQPILLFDAARQHITPRVLATAVRLRLWTIIVPAGTTGVLQPLDTHTFSRFKHWLRAECNVKGERDNGDQVHAFLSALKRSIEAVVLRTDWSSAFSSNGFAFQQECVSSRVLTALKWDVPVWAGSDVPSLDTLSLCFPKRTRVQREIILAPLLPPRVQLRRARPLADLARTSSSEVLGKTRSQTKRLRCGI